MAIEKEIICAVVQARRGKDWRILQCDQVSFAPEAESLVPPQSRAYAVLVEHILAYHPKTAFGPPAAQTIECDLAIADGSNIYVHTMLYMGQRTEYMGMHTTSIPQWSMNITPGIYGPCQGENEEPPHQCQRPGIRRRVTGPSFVPLADMSGEEVTRKTEQLREHWLYDSLLWKQAVTHCTLDAEKNPWVYLCDQHLTVYQFNVWTALAARFTPRTAADVYLPPDTEPPPPQVPCSI